MSEFPWAFLVLNILLIQEELQGVSFYCGGCFLRYSLVTIFALLVSWKNFNRKHKSSSSIPKYMAEMVITDINSFY